MVGKSARLTHRYFLLLSASQCDCSFNIQLARWYSAGEKRKQNKQTKKKKKKKTHTHTHTHTYTHTHTHTHKKKENKRTKNADHQFYPQAATYVDKARWLIVIWYKFINEIKLNVKKYGED